MLIKKNDRVVLLKAVTGAKNVDGRPLSKEARGSVGRVLMVDRKKGRVLVEGVNFVYRHVRPSQKYPQGGRIGKEAPWTSPASCSIARSASGASRSARTA